jgi:glutathione S-transferase
MSMKLYDWTNSYNSRKIVSIAFETDQKISCVPVNMQAGDNKKPEFLAMNPNGKVPLLVDGDFQLWESNAIACYVAAKDPNHRLLPTSAKERANVDKWLFWQTAHLSPSLGKIGYERLWKKFFGLGECDEAAVAAAMPDVTRFMSVLDTSLATNEWLAGKLSVADFANATALVNRDEIKLDISEWKNVKAWLGRIESRPSWQNAPKSWS